MDTREDIVESGSGAGSETDSLAASDQYSAHDHSEDPGSAGSSSGASAVDGMLRATTNSGRWTHEEHELFVRALETHGKNWRAIGAAIPWRNPSQLRSHAQKYFLKLEREGVDVSFYKRRANTHHSGPHRTSPRLSTGGSTRSGLLGGGGGGGGGGGVEGGEQEPAAGWGDAAEGDGGDDDAAAASHDPSLAQHMWFGPHDSARMMGDATPAHYGPHDQPPSPSAAALAAAAAFPGGDDAAAHERISGRKRSRAETVPPLPPGASSSGAASSAGAPQPPSAAAASVAPSGHDALALARARAVASLAMYHHPLSVLAPAPVAPALEDAEAIRGLLGLSS